MTLSLNCCRLVARNLLSVKLQMAHGERWVHHYSGPESDIKDICRQFSQLDGGRIGLVKDEETGIATITIDHPERRNALSGKMMVELHNVVDELETWFSGKAVLLLTSGEMFCSGGDLNTVRQIANPDDGYRMSTLMHSTLTRLHQLPLISAVLVQGKALGGGAELATSTDFRLFTQNGEIGFVQGRMGVITGWGGGTRLVQLVGHRRALDLLATGRQVPAQEALSMGLADAVLQCSDSTDAVQQARQWLQSRLKFAPQVIHAMKHMVATARAVPYESSLENERRLFAPLWGGTANQEALRQNIKHK